MAGSAGAPGHSASSLQRRQPPRRDIRPDQPVL